MFSNQNWAKIEKWRPRKKVYPKSLEDIQEIIRSAQQKGLKIRPIGSLHSYNDLCVTQDIQMHTDKLCKILSLDKNKMTVRVEGGIKIHALLDALAKEGVTLPNQGYIRRQSIAGAISTATHGSGNCRNGGTLSSFIEEVELVDADGKLHVLNSKANEHLFNAAVVNLGCLGIIYALTLRIIPLYRLRLTAFLTTFDEAIKQYPEWLKTYDFVHLVFNPYTDDVGIRLYQKSDENIQNVEKANHRKRRNKFFMNLFNWIGLPKSFALNWPKFIHKLSYVEESHRILSPEDEGRYVEEEISIPLEHLEKTVIEARQIIRKHAESHPWIIQAMYLRFVGRDPYGYLSPNLNQASFWMTFISVVRNGYKEIFQEYENAMLKYNGRPHWGKVHTLDKEKVQKLYPHTYSKFMEAKKTLDPEGLFTNDYIHRLFDLNNRSM